MRRTYTCAAAVILQGDKARSRLGEPVEPAAYLAAAAGDGEPMGFFFDESQTDEEHEAAIGQIRSYTGQNPFPVMAGGRIRRLEDVKKYLYAGAAAVFFREDDEGEMEIYREAVSRFGAGRTALYDPLTQTVAEEWEDFPEFAQLKKGADGLVPCIVQDVHSGQVLMMAYMNEEAYRRTLDTGRMTYFSRSPAVSVAEGRDFRTFSVSAFPLRRLRLGHVACPCGTGGRGLPHGFLFLFFQAGLAAGGEWAYFSGRV